MEMEIPPNSTQVLYKNGNAKGPAESEEDLTTGQKVKQLARKHLLVILIIIAAALGFIIGIAINSAVQKLEEPDRTTVVTVIGFPGDLLIRMLKMLILPLIVSSLIVGLSGLDAQVSGRLGYRAVAYYMSTTVLAVILGMILVSAMKPGKNAEKPPQDKRDPVKPLDSFLDIIRNMLPDNIVKACVMQGKTTIVEKKELVSARNDSIDFSGWNKSKEMDYRKKHKVYDVYDNKTKTNKTYVLVEKYRSYKIASGTKETTKANYLGLIVFSIAVGIVLGKMGEKAKTFIDFIDILNQVVMTLVHLVMCILLAQFQLKSFYCGTGRQNFAWNVTLYPCEHSRQNHLDRMVIYAANHHLNEVASEHYKAIGVKGRYSPIGIWSLVTAKFAGMSNIAATFASLGMFIATVVVGLAIHGLILLPLIYFIFVRKNPFKYIKGLVEAMATAFGTDSSAATLPVTFRCLEDNNGVDKRITRFVLPVGATINMDGTALYEAVAAIFIAQAVGRDLSAGDFVAISVTSTLASVGAAAVPHAGLVTMLIVLDTVGLPTDFIGVIYSVDWFLDRCRTMVNVLGDSIGAAIVEHLSRKDLDKMDAFVEEGKDNLGLAESTHL